MINKVELVEQYFEIFQSLKSILTATKIMYLFRCEIHLLIWESSIFLLIKSIEHPIILVRSAQM